MSLHLGLLQHLEYKRFRREIKLNSIYFMRSGFKGTGRGGRGRATFLFFFSEVFYLSNGLFFGHISLKFEEDR